MRLVGNNHVLVKRGRLRALVAKVEVWLLTLAKVVGDLGFSVKRFEVAGIDVLNVCILIRKVTVFRLVVGLSFLSYDVWRRIQIQLLLLGGSLSRTAQQVFVSLLDRGIDLPFLQ